MSVMHSCMGFLKKRFIWLSLKTMLILPSLSMSAFPRAWFERFTSQLLHISFCASIADGNLFILRHGSSIVFLLLYLDDIIITGNKSSFVSSVIKLLGVDFDLKDLG